MIAPVTFTQSSGLRITIDSDDVCGVEETSPEGTTDVVTAVTYAPTGEVLGFFTETPHETVIGMLAEAVEKAHRSRSLEDGDEWKEGGNDADS